MTLRFEYGHPEEEKLGRILSRLSPSRRIDLVKYAGGFKFNNPSTHTSTLR